MNRFTKLSHTATLLVISLVCITLTPAAFAAADEDPVPQVRLSAAGTDFTSPASIAHLRSRLRHAAIAICTPNWDGRRMLATDERQCYDTALTNGMAQVESRHQEALRKTTVNMAAAQLQEPLAH